MQANFIIVDEGYARLKQGKTSIPQSESKKSLKFHFLTVSPLRTRQPPRHQKSRSKHLLLNSEGAGHVFRNTIQGCKLLYSPLGQRPVILLFQAGILCFKQPKMPISLFQTRFSCFKQTFRKILGSHSGIKNPSQSIVA